MPSDSRELYRVSRLTYSLKTKCLKLAKTKVRDAIHKLEMFGLQGVQQMGVLYHLPYSFFVINKTLHSIITPRGFSNLSHSHLIIETDSLMIGSSNG